MTIEKLKQASLRGRGGAGFPTWQKWEMVKNAAGSKKYVVCNVSEGEPAVFKDDYILENYPQSAIDGIDLALKATGAQKAYLYLRKDYYDKYENDLRKIIKNKPIELFREPCGYLGGEETVLLEVIEGKPAQPRMKPPYPPQAGLYGCPTLINNLETFYYAAKIEAGEYKNTRFYSISGDIANGGVYELPENISIKEVLDQTGNLSQKDFFVQAGGGASGTILLRHELDQPLQGAGSLVVHDMAATNPKALGLQWANFFIEENCGKCVPCREGVYRLREIFSQDSVDIPTAKSLIANLKDSSFCPFGKGVANSFDGLVNKLMK